tara:strand:- start:68 stop:571 length:504 start_codon:yes stop_codon:yes gene_type:complete
MLRQIEYINVENELDKFFKSVIKQSRSNLTKKGINASKDLYRSLNYDIDVNKNSIEADFLMEDYGDFIDKGVKGVKEGRSLAGYKYTNKKPPVRFIKTWLKRKTGKFRQRNQDSIAYAIQNTIYKRGIKPTEFFSKPFKNEFNKLPDEIIEAYGLDLDDFMEFVLNK